MNTVESDLTVADLPHIKTDGQTYMGRRFPLVDARRGRVGLILALRNVTPSMVMLQTLLYITVACFAGVGTVMLLLLKGFLEKLEKEFASAYTPLAQQATPEPFEAKRRGRQDIRHDRLVG